MPDSVATILERFNSVFNANDLDGVMAYFADDAVYEPGDGAVHRGRAQIRAAFAPQFAGAFGTMRFDVVDTLVDEPARKATTRWVCRHDISNAPRMSRLLRLAVRLRHGHRFGWNGVDVFHLTADGKIAGKFTYANYDRPQLRSQLG